MKIKRYSNTPKEKIIYVAAIAETHRCKIAYIIVNFTGKTEWKSICRPFGSGFCNMKEKTLYAEAYALQEAKRILKRKSVNPETFEVYFYSLKNFYKISLPSPVTLEKTFKLAQAAVIE